MKLNKILNLDDFESYFKDEPVPLKQIILEAPLGIHAHYALPLNEK